MNPTFFDPAVFTAPGAPVLLFLVKATILLLAALGVTIAMQRASAGSRHLVWLVSLGSLLILPALAAWSPLRLEILPAAREQSRAPQSANPTVNQPQTPAVPSTDATDRAAAPAAPMRASETVAAPTAATTLSPARMLLAIWAVVALICAAWLGHGVLSVHRITRRARPLDSADWLNPLYEIADRLALEEAPRLLRSQDVKMPFACGLVRPTIVLPSECDGWSADRRHAVLLHELGHVQRRDLVGHTLGRIACVLYWFHPLVWTAARKLRAESERACDDIALACGARATDYAEHLLDIVSSVRNHNTPSIALAMAHRKEFEGRMLAILDPELHRAAPSRPLSSALIATFVAFAIVIGAAMPAAAPATAATIPPALDVAGASSHSDSSGGFDTRRTVQVNTTEQQRSRQETRVEQRTTLAQPAAHGRQEAQARQEVVGTPRPAPDPSPKAVVTLKDLISDSVAQDDRPALLAGILRSDSSEKLRKVAAWGLARHAETDVAIAALTRAVRRDVSPAVREMSAWALGRSDGHAMAVTALIEALKTDSSEKVRATSAWALGNADDEEAIDALSASLGDKDDRVRRVSAWAIGHITPDRAPQRLIAMLGDAESKNRELAAWALFRIEDVESASALETALAKETDSKVQRAFMYALASMGDKSIEAIKRLLDSKDPEVRAIAIQSLAGGDMGPWPWPWPDPRPYP